MWLEAILSKDDVDALAAELLPLSVHLGPPGSDHYVRLSRATEVELVDECGLRLRCDAQIHWPVLGVAIPLDVRGLTVMLEPSVRRESDSLHFGLRVEHADIVWVPSLVDGVIIDAINDALRHKSDEFVWNFAGTLSHDFALPDSLRPLRALGLGVRWGKVRTTPEGIALAVSFTTRAIRDGDTDENGRLVGPVTPNHGSLERNASARLARTPSPSPVSVAIATAVALTTAYVALRGVRRLLFGRPRVWLWRHAA